VINDLDSFTVSSALTLLYDAIAAAITSGAILGIAAVWLSTSFRGTDAS
jgi:hypothetical protein